MSTAASSSPGRDPALLAGIASRIGTILTFLILNGALLFPHDTGTVHRETEDATVRGVTSSMAVTTAIRR